MENIGRSQRHFRDPALPALSWRAPSVLSIMQRVRVPLNLDDVIPLVMACAGSTSVLLRCSSAEAGGDLETIVKMYDPCVVSNSEVELFRTLPPHRHVVNLLSEGELEVPEAFVPYLPAISRAEALQGGQPTTTRFLQLQYYPRGSVSRGTAPPPLERLRLCYEVALGVQHLEEHGFVHFALNSDHVLLANDGSAVLCGLSSAYRTPRAGSLVYRGKVQAFPVGSGRPPLLFLPPECREILTRSGDAYVTLGLGGAMAWGSAVVVYQILLWDKDAHPLDRLGYLQQPGRARPALLLPEWVPEDVRQLLCHMLRCCPDDRPSMLEVLRSLRRFGRDLPADVWPSCFAAAPLHSEAAVEAGATAAADAYATAGSRSGAQEWVAGSARTGAAALAALAEPAAAAASAAAAAMACASTPTSARSDLFRETLEMRTPDAGRTSAAERERGAAAAMAAPALVTDGEWVRLDSLEPLEARAPAQRTPHRLPSPPSLYLSAARAAPETRSVADSPEARVPEVTGSQPSHPQPRAVGTPWQHVARAPEAPAAPAADCSAPLSAVDDEEGEGHIEDPEPPSVEPASGERPVTGLDAATHVAGLGSAALGLGAAAPAAGLDATTRAAGLGAVVPAASAETPAASADTPAASLGAAAPVASLGAAVPAASLGAVTPPAGLGAAALAASLGAVMPAASLGAETPSASLGAAAPAASLGAVMPAAGLGAVAPAAMAAKKAVEAVLATVSAQHQPQTLRVKLLTAAERVAACRSGSHACTLCVLEAAERLTRATGVLLLMHPDNQVQLRFLRLVSEACRLATASAPSGDAPDIAAVWAAAARVLEPLLYNWHYVHGRRLLVPKSQQERQLLRKAPSPSLDFLSKQAEAAGALVACVVAHAGSLRLRAAAVLAHTTADGRRRLVHAWIQSAAAQIAQATDSSALFSKDYAAAASADAAAPPPCDHAALAELLQLASIEPGASAEAAEAYEAVVSALADAVQSGASGRLQNAVVQLRAHVEGTPLSVATKVAVRRCLGAVLQRAGCASDV